MISDDDPSMQQVVDFVTDRVAPGKHSNLAINPNHRTVLTGLKSKKQLSNKKVRKNEKPSKTLTRKQFAELGLYTLPTKSLKYTDMLPLHDMWTQYIRQQLKLYLIGNGEEQRIPEVHEATYDAFSKAVVKADLHGAIIKVAASKCPSLVGQTGIVVMETKNSFKIVSRDNRTRSGYFSSVVISLGCFSRII